MWALLVLLLAKYIVRAANFKTNSEEAEVANMLVARDLETFIQQTWRPYATHGQPLRYRERSKARFRNCLASTFPPGEPPNSSKHSCIMRVLLSNTAGSTRSSLHVRDQVLHPETATTHSYLHCLWEDTSFSAQRQRALPVLTFL